MLRNNVDAFRAWATCDVPRYSLKGVYYHAQLEERVSLVKTKVDSLLRIPQSPLAVEDLNMSCMLERGVCLVFTLKMKLLKITNILNTPQSQPCLT